MKLHDGTGVGIKRVSDTPTNEAAAGIVTTVTPGGQSYVENTWRVPFNANAVSVSAVVDTAAEITTVVQGLYNKMSPGPEIISSKDMNLAWSAVTITVGALGDGIVEIREAYVKRVFCTITGRHAPGF